MSRILEVFCKNFGCEGKIFVVSLEHNKIVRSSDDCVNAMSVVVEEAIIKGTKDETCRMVSSYVKGSLIHYETRLNPA